MKNIKYLFLAGIVLTMFACSNTPTVSELTNTKASLPPSFNFDQLGLKAITTFINKKQGTTSTLYGNPLALKTAIAGTNKIVAGEVLALVTWKQKADENWFGANIPGAVNTIELIKTSAGSGGAPVVAYSLYKGKEFILSKDTTDNHARIKYIFDQQPSVMP